MNLRYQVTIGTTARECRMGPGNTVSIKVGMQGRVILGPEGGNPGTVNVPLRFAVVRETIDTKVITTKLDRVAVTIPPNDSNVLFTHVAEGLDFPMPRGGEIDSYVIYIGFDPAAAGAGAQEAGAEAKAETGQARPPDRLSRSSLQDRAGTYQPRSATTVLLSARMSAITARAPALVRCAPRVGLVWLPPMKPIGTMPAACAAETPAGKSSTTMQSAGSTRILAATCRNRSGAGLPRGNVACREQVGLEEPQDPGAFEADPDAVERRRGGHAFRPAQPGQRMLDMGGGAELRRAAGAAWRRPASSAKFGGSLRLVAVSMSTSMSIGRRPAKKRATISGDTTKPARVSSVAATLATIASLSTSTPLQSKMNTGGPRYGRCRQPPPCA